MADILGLVRLERTFDRSVSSAARGSQPRRLAHISVHYYSVEAGMLGVPAPVAWFPFSGWKDSIDGDLHANGTDAVEFYTRKKVVTTPW